MGSLKQQEWLKLRKAPEREGGEETFKDVELDGPWQRAAGEAGGGFLLCLRHGVEPITYTFQRPRGLVQSSQKLTSTAVLKVHFAFQIDIY